MRTAKDWKQFEVIDTSGGEKLERWGDVILTRPDPQVIWNTPKGDVWRKTNARYLRSSSGGGKWEIKNMPRDHWTIEYKQLRFKISPTGFKHTGLFPEQAVNWDFMADKIKNAGREVSVLNLFAYTGGATLACAAAGAKVCHVDASKGMVAWARENAQLSNLQDKRFAGLWTTAKSLLNARSAAAIVMMESSWTRLPTAEARAERCGSWKTRL